MKTCARCKESKPTEQFNVCKPNRDGLQGYCRTCQLSYNKLRARNNPEVRREQQKRRYIHEIKSNGYRMSKKSTPEKRRAHHVVSKAVKAGKLLRPSECSRCKSTRFQIQAHHADYSKPLSVIWLCAPCHGDEHATSRRQEEKT